MTGPSDPYRLASGTRVKTYVCGTPYNFCGSTPIYSGAPLGSWATVSAGQDYVDPARITVEYD